MSLIDEEANLESLRQSASIPMLQRETPKVERSNWHLLTAPGKAVPAAIWELAADAGEIAVGTVGVAKQIANTDPEKAADVAVDFAKRFPFQTMRDAAKDSGASDLVKWDGKNWLSDAYRDAVKNIRPDPAVASVAETMLFEMPRVVTKAIGLTRVAGPAAIPLMGVSEGFAETDKLQRQGVDDTTARDVGAVAGLMTTVGGFIPAAPLAAKGITAANTAKVAGLAAVSGPATFAAQQQISREVLAAADYKQIAEQYDPLDPLGLTLSAAAPFVFGMASLRTGKAGKGKPAETPKAEPVKADEPAPTQAQVDAAMVHNLGAKAAEMEAVISGEIVRDVTPARVDLASWMADNSFKPAETVPEKVGGNQFVSFIKQQGGIAYALKNDIVGEGGFLGNYAGIFTKKGLQLDELVTRARESGYMTDMQIADAGDTGGTRALAEMIRRAATGERILTSEQEIAAKVSEGVRRATADAVDAIEKRLLALGVDPSPAKGDIDLLTRYMDEHGDTLVNAKLADIGESTMPLREVYGREFGLEPESVGRLDLVALASRVDELAVERAAIEAADEVDFANRIKDILIHEPTSAKTPGGSQGSGARPEIPASPAKPAEPAAQPAAGKAVQIDGGDRPKIQAVANRAEAVLAENPDMVVRTVADEDGSVGKRVTVAEEIELLRREAMEGTDTELGFADAELVKVAAECALMMGSTL